MSAAVVIYVLLTFILPLNFFSATLSLAACWYSDDIEAIKSRIAWCMDLLPPPIIFTSFDILSPNLVKSYVSFSGALLPCNSGGDKQDLSPFCVSGREWSNLGNLRKEFRSWVALAPSDPAGEVAPIKLFLLFNATLFYWVPTSSHSLGFVVWLSILCYHGYLSTAGRPSEGWHKSSWALVFRVRLEAKQETFLTAPTPQLNGTSPRSFFKAYQVLKGWRLMKYGSEAV